MKKFTICIVAFVALIAPVSPVFAGTATGALNIQTNLLSACSVSTTPVNFGDISSPFNGTATGEVIVNCQSGSPYHIALDAGTNYSGGAQYRSLVTGGGTTIDYNLAKCGETLTTRIRLISVLLLPIHRPAPIKSILSLGHCRAVLRYLAFILVLYK